jgi:hypothetical protein
MIAARRWVIAGLLVGGMIAAMFGVRVPRAYACECSVNESEEQNIEREFQRADTVFMGRALKDSGTEVDDHDPSTATFLVETVWKGPVHQVITVYNDPVNGGCMSEIRRGETYLIYAYGPKHVLEPCTRTMHISGAEFDLQWLGSGTVPTDEPIPTPTKPPLTLEAPQQDKDTELLPAFDPTIGVVLLAVIALLVLALFIVMRRGGKA